MNNESTLKGLRYLRLKTMAETAQRMMDSGQCTGLSSNEFLALLVDAEMSSRKTKRFDRSLKMANLRPENACLENFRHDKGRGLAKAELQPFLTASWIDRGQNIVLTGPTGVGKTYLAEALIFQACKMGFKGRKIGQALLMEEIRVARVTGAYIKYLKATNLTRVLVIDDFLITKPTTEEAGELLTILEERVNSTPTIITSQYPVEKWHERIPDPTIADALCDRLLEGSKIIQMTGHSQRGRKEV